MKYSAQKENTKVTAKCSEEMYFSPKKESLMAISAIQN